MKQDNKAKEKALEFLDYWENVTKSTAVNKAKYEKAIDMALKEQANLFDEFLQDLNKIKYRVDLDERISNMREELKKKFIKG